ncbi:MAG: CoB--CoM heterodisulfide reductase iron-sulfur subunit A family protein [Deltaproteobacteria bacterium]|nr:CoB--CoM heterodisulfide reductase iron-sulfur subunit A family protein [Deltaproteobacteria bacterium]
MSGVGVFICHCGKNIAASVDVAELARRAKRLPGVRHAEDYPYMCSDPGQDLIRRAARAHGLEALVLANCSPSLHLLTFQELARQIGINPYRVEVANVREACSWPHREQPVEATEKARDIIAAAVRRVRRDRPLIQYSVPIQRSVLVLGGGIAGLSASLEIARMGYGVVLAERSPHLGGRLLHVGPTAPDNIPGRDLVEPLSEKLSSFKHVRVLTRTEIDTLEGTVGNFRVRLRVKPRGVDQNQSPGYGEEKSKFEEACPEGAIMSDTGAKWVEEEVGAVIVATGYELLSTAELPELGGDDPDVVDPLTFEKMLGLDELKGGYIVRPSDDRAVRRVAFVQCAGSRDPERHFAHCSRICCSVSARQALRFRERMPEGEAWIFAMDIRSPGRDEEVYLQRAVEEGKIVMVRGRPSGVERWGDRLRVRSTDTLAPSLLEVETDLVVLSSAVTGGSGAQELSRILHVSVDEAGFFTEAHVKLRPAETLTRGIFLAGMAQAPRNIPESAASGQAAAAKVLELFSQPHLVREPTVAQIDPLTCSGCGLCVEACVYDAIEMLNGQGPARVKEILCEACGACQAVCPSGAAWHRNHSTRQIIEMIQAHLETTGDRFQSPRVQPMNNNYLEGRCVSHWTKT